jgi:hypothetical protein
MVDAQQAGQLGLDPFDLGSHDVALTVADPRDRGENLVAQRLILAREVEERHPGRHGVVNGY